MGTGHWSHPGGQVRPLQFARQSRHQLGGCDCLSYQVLLQVENKSTYLPPSRSQRHICQERQMRIA